MADLAGSNFPWAPKTLLSGGATAASNTLKLIPAKAESEQALSSKASVDSRADKPATADFQRGDLVGPPCRPPCVQRESARERERQRETCLISRHSTCISSVLVLLYVLILLYVSLVYEALSYQCMRP